ncbi:hypothetical protein AN189_15190 [Loktanella sp. 3ANDIMAR09]|uniref:hypothetical protein n=1 Tax=Loktanella sp. 3ANDIMAR09 TaxID=1225657 RepID=UPI0006FC7CF5|nr:hypothetical protein [Loktanella sp. 3ANDIMAR09]KQI67483.1 hypothetical protein AN189_15190 [Loktanella sp. 3ANDIMAR09]
MMRRGPARRDLAWLFVGVVMLHLVLVLPSHPAGLTGARWFRPTPELPLILLCVAILPRVWVLAPVVVVALGLAVLKIADIGTYLAFSRAFNPLLDLHLLVSGWALLASSIGHGQALFGISATLLVVIAVGAVMWRGLWVLSRLGWRLRSLTVAVPAGLAVLAMVLPGWQVLQVTPLVQAQFDRMGRGIADLREFTADLPDPVGPVPTFAALQGRDVILAFVESYGRSFLDDPEFAATSVPRLASVETALDAAGWHVRSGWVAAPTRGGQSWLSHGTLLSGLWVDSQVRYDRLMTSDRTSLNRLFGAAGWHTGAAMPAITLDWPEAGWYGYDTTLDAAGLDYRGQPFEWVTMPDQYTWTALDEKLRKAVTAPAMIEVALITSHAPWTPLPDIVPWDAVGDGSVFDRTRRQGDSPRVVWSDPATIRAQYAKSLDYALEVAGQYILRHGDGAFFVVLGDHQPAPLLAGQDAPPDVPVHFISDDPRLLDRLPADVFARGIVPATDAPVLPMQDLRVLLTTLFETPL